jgi:hypothetical protein
MSDYGIRATLAHLSGGKVTDMPTPEEQEPGMTTAELLRATTLSGTHSVSRTVRGSWQPLSERPPRPQDELYARWSEEWLAAHGGAVDERPR